MRITGKLLSEEEVVERIKEDLKTHTQKNLAEYMGISSQYLSDVIRGQRVPGEAVLRYFNLEKVVVYVERTK